MQVLRAPGNRPERQIVDRQPSWRPRSGRSTAIKNRDPLESNKRVPNPRRGRPWVISGEGIRPAAADAHPPMNRGGQCLGAHGSPAMPITALVARLLTTPSLRNRRQPFPERLRPFLCLSPASRAPPGPGQKEAEPRIRHGATRGPKIHEGKKSLCSYARRAPGRDIANAR